MTNSFFDRYTKPLTEYETRLKYLPIGISVVGFYNNKDNMLECFVRTSDENLSKHIIESIPTASLDSCGELTFSLPFKKKIPYEKATHMLFDACMTFENKFYSSQFLKKLIEYDFEFNGSFGSIFENDTFYVQLKDSEKTDISNISQLSTIHWFSNIIFKTTSGYSLSNKLKEIRNKTYLKCKRNNRMELEFHGYLCDWTHLRTLLTKGRV